jgi:hypothetical protein
MQMILLTLLVETKKPLENMPIDVCQGLMMAD